MFGSSVVAPVALCTVIAAGLAVPNPAHSPVSSSAATRTTTFQLTSLTRVDSVARPESPPTAAATAGVPLPFGLPQVLAIMTALAAFNPGASATMQFINKELLDELAEGTPLGEAMVNVSLLLSPPSLGGPVSPLAPILDQIGPMLALAPTVAAGAMTVVAAIPEAVIPVMGAVVVGVFNAATAAGSDRFAAVVETGLYRVMTAVAKGIETMVNVVTAVLHDIAGVTTLGSASRVPAPAESVRVPSVVEPSATTAKVQAKTPRKAVRATVSPTPAKDLASPQPRHSASASATVSSDRATAPVKRGTQAKAKAGANRAN